MEWDRRSFRERSVQDGTIPEDRPHAPLIEVVSGGLAPRGKVLNIHCGMGSDSLYLAQEDYEVVAAGLSSSDVEEVGKMAREAGARISTSVIDPDALPFEDGEFDLIVDTGCILKVDGMNREGLIRELHRTLRRGGRMFTMLPVASEGPEGFTRSSIEEMFHPPFEILMIDSVPVDDMGGIVDHRYLYSVLMERV